MTLLMKGWGEQRPGWHVNEPVAAGYSRVYFLEEGNILYQEAGTQRMLTPGILYVFPATTPYSITLNASHVFTCIWLHMDFFPTALSSLLEIPLQGDPILSGYARLLHAIFCISRHNTSYADGVIQSFSDYLEQEYLPGETSPLGEIVGYIRENFRDCNLNVAGISAHFGYSPEHFIRLFSRSLGITPYQYLLNMRMYEARRLLLENLTVNQTAAAVGYDNPRTFSHAFQKKHGVPPGEFRRSFSEMA